MTRALLCLGLLLSAPLPAQTESGQPFDIWALQRITRISDPQLSPDGSTVAFVGEKTLLSENAKRKHIYTLPIDGGRARQLTFEGKSNSRPRWSPDSSQIVFLSDREDSSQIWLMAADGDDKRRVTDLPTEASGVKFFPDGGRLLFASRVFQECGADMDCNQRRLQEREDNPVRARSYDELLYRRWDEWDDGRVGHLFIKDLVTGELRDLTPGDFDVPPFSLGGMDAYDIAPDGQTVCFAVSVGQKPAVSTNVDLYVVNVEEGGRPAALTEGPASETSPLYSPDGRYLAYRAQERAGYESDRYRLMLLDLMVDEDSEEDSVVSLTENLDRWVSEIAWAPDSSRLFFTAEDRGRAPIFTVAAQGGGMQAVVFGDAHHGDVQLTPDARSMIYSVHSASHPVEIYRGFSSGGPPIQLTHLNDDVMEAHESGEVEEITYESIDGTSISGFLVQPPNFDFERKYPLLLLIHGGPQGAWGEGWSYRWNPQVFASAGYIVFMPNPRGSTGYGQALTDAINGDWGGLVYEDIMAGVDYVLRRPYVDSNKLVAAGGSFGGYMINWMLGRTTRFRAFVSHAGVYDLRSMFGSTEELFFPIWEFDGTPWENPESYERWSPSRFVTKFQTPTLVIHGENDFRVPFTQSMQLFTALQLREVPSKFLYFPDEGHWILKPRNSIHWYETVIDWFDQWIERIHRPSTPPMYMRPVVDPSETEETEETEDAEEEAEPVNPVRPDEPRPSPLQPDKPRPSPIPR